MLIKVGDRLKHKDGDTVQVLLVTADELLVIFDKKREGGSHEVLKLPIYQDWKAV